MIVTPLATPPVGAVRGALLSHGWEGASSEEAAAGLEACAFHVTGLSSDLVEQLLRLVPRYGLDLLTGDGWALLAGTRTRLSTMARSWSLPPELRPLAIEIGRALPADRPQYWRLADRVVALDAGPVLLGGSVTGPAIVSDDEFSVLAADLGGFPMASGTGHGGILLHAASPDRAWSALSAVLDQLAGAGIDPDRVAVDPGWGASSVGPGMGRFRALGRPVVCSTEDPVIAALAWLHGAQLFRTTRPDAILQALVTAERLDS